MAETVTPKSGDAETRQDAASKSEKDDASRPQRRRRRKADLAELTGVRRDMLEGGSNDNVGFSKVLYDGFASYFGNMNPFQMLSLTWPATVLDEAALNWQPEADGFIMPPRVRAMTAQILDTYIPPAPLTQPDGSRVSDRYRSVVANFGPIPNAAMLNLQRLIREKLQQKVIIEEDGKEIEVTVAHWFDILHARYIAATRSWATARATERKRLQRLFPGEPDKQTDAYMEWYGINARTYTDKITAAHNRLLSEFPLREWEAAIAILDTGADPILTRARMAMEELTIPIPPELGGGDYAMATGEPISWNADLETSTGELDYLDTPTAKFRALSNAIRALQAEALSWAAIMPTVNDDEVRQRLDAFQASVQTYEETRTALSQKWTDSVYVVVDAVASYLDATQKGPNDFLEQMAETDDGQELTQNLINATASSAGAAGKKVDYDEIKKMTKKLTDQQNGVWAAHDAAIAAGSDLAGKATSWLEAKGRSTDLQWIFTYVEQLKTKLHSLERLQTEMMQASMAMWNKLWDPKHTMKVGKEEVIGAFVPLTEKAIPENGKGKITPRKSYAQTGQPTPYASKKPDTWTEVKIELSKKQMESQDTLKTSFSRRQWGVNFFFGSYGKTQENETSHFASQFMSNNSEIQLRMLAKKVNIRRNWLNPLLFTNSADYFRAHKRSYTSEDEVTSELLQDNINLQEELHRKVMPAYPVSLLVVKDVTIRMNFDFSETQRMKDYVREFESSGGGFFMFNTSSVSSSSDSREAVSINVEAGEMEVKFKSPQIVGYYLELTPPDLSTELNETVAEEIAQAISFLGTLKGIHEDAVRVDEENLEDV